MDLTQRTDCPLCHAPIQSSRLVRLDLMPHPYMQCTDCGIYYQPVQTPKVFEAYHEKSGDQMSEADRNVNRNLANILFQYRKKFEANLNRPLKHLDIGTKYPYLGHSLQNCSQGLVTSYGIDGIDKVGHFGAELGVKVLQVDFESPMDSWQFPADITREDFQSFDIITLVHCAEHFYNPVGAFAKVCELAANKALLFIRCPDHETAGIERDFTEGHYQIHPLIWNYSSMTHLAEELRSFDYHLVLFETYNFAGQRDYFFQILK